MNALTHAAPLAAPSGAARALQRLVSGLHWLRIAYAEQRRAARARAELALLDERSLHDLGLTRSEIESCLAESAGAAARTRRRIYSDASGWWPR